MPEALKLLLSSPLMFVFVFLFGLCIGSFLNVCIRRIPSQEGLSIVFPASHCMTCKTPIKPYDNIPVFSYLILAGKCRACRAPISIVYPLVEMLTALLFVACYLEFGPSFAFFKWVIFCSLIVVLVFTDIFDRILPDGVNFLGLALALVFSFFSPDLGDSTINLISQFSVSTPAPSIWMNLAGALLGAAFGYGLLWSFATVYRKVTGREGMGMGDWKMMAMVGAFLGPQFTFMTIFAGTLLGSTIGSSTILILFLSGWKSDVAARAHRRGLGEISRLRFVRASRYWLPLGTFLGAGAILVVFFGERGISWYLRHSGIK